MSGVIVGIDPGLTGAIASYSAEMGIQVWDMPTLKLKKGKNTTSALNISHIVWMLSEFQSLPSHIILEQQQSMPKQGVSSTFKTGVGYGILLGIIAALGVPHTIVASRTWKKRIGVTADKDGSRLRASQLYPELAFPLVKDHGKAEAVLLAHYGRMTLLATEVA